MRLVTTVIAFVLVSCQILQAAPFEILLLNKLPSDHEKWSDKEILQVIKETLVLNEHMRNVVSEARKTGDLKPIQEDVVFDKTKNAFILFQEKGYDTGPLRPCFLSMMFYTKVGGTLVLNTGESIVNDFQWMNENCSRCEKLLK